ncbi:MAG: mechanosensitive ion channel [Bacteroidales bacterium]|nr:mechanosensitive ion channel [Bacteroidales bacterium]
MHSILKYLAVPVACLLLSLPVRSADPETESRTPLATLLDELRVAYASAIESDSLLVNSIQRQEEIARMLKSADEVTVMLYTQRPEFAFDMAFALENVSRIYADFQEKVRLANRYVVTSRAGLRRYSLLDETLQEMFQRHPVDSLLAMDSLLVQAAPAILPEEDPEKAILLDSCLHYTGILKDLYGESVKLALQDSIYFADTERRLQNAYDYAQANYAETQKNRYIGGNVNVVHVLKNWGTFTRYVKDDLRLRYHTDTGIDSTGEGTSISRTWSGRYVLTYAALSLILLLASFLLAGLISSLAFKYIRKDNVRSFRPILSSILAVLLFAVGVLLVKSDRTNPYWRMAYQLLSQFSWLTLAIFISLLIRIKGSQAKASRNIYVPTLLLAFLCILMRAVFLPASAVPLVLPPTLLLFILWQSLANVRYGSEVNLTDLRYMWVSVGVMGAACVLSLAGFSMIGVLLLTFWTFQLALLHTITTLYYLMKRYYEDRVLRRKARYLVDNPKLPLPLDDKNAFIEVTWFYDLLRMVVVPLATLVSFPLSILLTSRAYQLSLTGADLMRHPFIQGYDSLNLSKVLLVIGLFFVFRYLIYVMKGLFRVFKLRGIIEKRGDAEAPLKESDVNLSLSNTIITLFGWLLYAIISLAILSIPTKAITYISTGLAAGVGFALKDLINNFFYGIQLMAGRIRVGDKISCDGVRGIVKRVSYQTTQVEDEDGSLIAFTNTDLFTKKFRNLNTGRNYEFIKMPVSVKYGTDIALARKVILEAIEPLMTKDKNGRDVVDPSFPVDVRFDGYGDSSVNLVVALYTTVETHYTFPARAKEAIYNAFYKNGIEIPFPQRDLYLKSVPAEKGKH